jgi:hypothetical protein
VNLTGKWTGAYLYDAGPELAAVTFTLNLRHRWLGYISGSVIDGPGGMPEEGKVAGRLRGRQLLFRKLMPRFRVTAAKGTELASEHPPFERFAIPADAAHPPILYEGLVSDAGATASGVWRVAEHVVILEDGMQGLQFPGYSGSWTASRVT